MQGGEAKNILLAWNTKVKNASARVSCRMARTEAPSASLDSRAGTACKTGGFPLNSNLQHEYRILFFLYTPPSAAWAAPDSGQGGGVGRAPPGTGGGGRGDGAVGFADGAVDGVGAVISAVAVGSLKSFAFIFFLGALDMTYTVQKVYRRSSRCHKCHHHRCR